MLKMFSSVDKLSKDNSNSINENTQKSVIAFEKANAILEKGVKANNGASIIMDDFLQNQKNENQIIITNLDVFKSFLTNSINTFSSSINSNHKIQSEEKKK